MDCVLSVFIYRLNFVVLIDRIITTLFLFKKQIFDLLGGYCQRGVPLSCLYPPLTQTFLRMAKNQNKTSVERKHHIYSFECDDFLIHVKAYNMRDAINRFHIYFGEFLMVNIKQITSSDYGKD